MSVVIQRVAAVWIFHDKWSAKTTFTELTENLSPQINPLRSNAEGMGNRYSMRWQCGR
jgi:hypothetical protein